jgi:excinuclease ABC subunit B
MSAIQETAEPQQEQKKGEFISFPDSPFELFMPYPPAGDQPQAIEKLVEGVNDGEVFQTLRRTARSTSTSSRCGCRPPRACWSGATR